MLFESLLRRFACYRIGDSTEADAVYLRVAFIHLLEDKVRRTALPDLVDPAEERIAPVVALEQDVSHL